MDSERVLAYSSAWSAAVLILVLMEDGLGVRKLFNNKKPEDCLNPCFNGRWTRSARIANACQQYLDVLILVLMEDGLGARKDKLEETLRNKS